ncbi:MAG: DUF5615 family PIN-like protein [Planctomycetes bacterium]|jgi:predicted nuclease of predicted toxin-antitoxin system|nr:DUF5615 family PIN-like protein [Planctomycetota bacterium]
MIHVRDYGIEAAADRVIFKRAADEQRTVITADTDFGLLLARKRTRQPSVMLFHQSFSHRPTDQGEALLENLPELTSALERGSLVVLESRRIRIRTLPIIP